VKEVNGYPRPYPRGGKAAYFYASLMFRVARAADGVAGQYFASAKGSSSDQVIGTRHTVQLRKSSFGNITELGNRWVETEYFLSNGLGPSPTGVDRARDLLESALARGVLAQAGSSIRFGDETIGRGFATSHRTLVENTDVYNRILEAFWNVVDEEKEQQFGLTEE
jgi:hypothetical protein